MQDLTTEEQTTATDALKERGPELAVAGCMMLLAALAITDSLRIGIGWADDGPKSGYFPFYIGLILLASSATIFVSTLWKWRASTEVFAGREQLATVGAMLAPTTVYIFSIIWLGMYLPSMLLIGFFMRRYGKFGWVATCLVSVAVPVAFFLVFERWFLVPLPKGPIENWLGF